MRFLACSMFLFVSAGIATAQDQTAKDAAVVQTLLRLSGIDITSRPDLQAAVMRHLKTIEGEEEYFELLQKFKLRAAADDLLAVIKADPASTQGITSAKLLLEWEETEKLQNVLRGENAEAGAAVAASLGHLGTPAALEMLLPLVTDEKCALAVRSSAVSGLGRNLPGQKLLLAIVEAGELPADLSFAAANALLGSASEEIRTAAGKHLSLPASADSEPLPPLAMLLEKKGDIAAGLELFRTKGTCSKCHKVQGEGKEVGPDLTEIGSKLSREAMYISILDPSAAVSHNYETHSFLMEDGRVVTGIIASETDDAYEIKTAEAIVQKLAKSEIEEAVKQKTSLMPSDLQKNLTAEDLVNMVEFLVTLKKQ